MWSDWESKGVRVQVFREHGIAEVVFVGPLTSSSVAGAVRFLGRHLSDGRTLAIVGRLTGALLCLTGMELNAAIRPWVATNAWLRAPAALVCNAADFDEFSAYAGGMSREGTLRVAFSDLERARLWAWKRASARAEHFAESGWDTTRPAPMPPA